MPKEETVSIKKSELQTILKEIKSLKKEVQELREKKTVHTTTSRSTPVFHSLSKSIQETKVREQIENREKVEHLLSEAADLAIKDYKLNPPRNRR